MSTTKIKNLTKRYYGVLQTKNSNQQNRKLKIIQRSA